MFIRLTIEPWKRYAPWSDDQAQPSSAAQLPDDAQQWQAPTQWQPHPIVQLRTSQQGYAGDELAFIVEETHAWPLAIIAWPYQLCNAARWPEGDQFPVAFEEDAWLPRTVQDAWHIQRWDVDEEVLPLTPASTFEEDAWLPSILWESWGRRWYASGVEDFPVALEETYVIPLWPWPTAQWARRLAWSEEDSLSLGLEEDSWLPLRMVDDRLCRLLAVDDDALPPTLAFGLDEDARGCLVRWDDASFIRWFLGEEEYPTPAVPFFLEESGWMPHTQDMAWFPQGLLGNTDEFPTSAGFTLDEDTWVSRTAWDAWLRAQWFFDTNELPVVIDEEGWIQRPWVASWSSARPFLGSDEFPTIFDDGAWIPRAQRGMPTAIRWVIGNDELSISPVFTLDESIWSPRILWDAWLRRRWFLDDDTFPTPVPPFFLDDSACVLWSQWKEDTLLRYRMFSHAEMGEWVSTSIIGGQGGNDAFPRLATFAYQAMRYTVTVGAIRVSERHSSGIVWYTMS